MYQDLGKYTFDNTYRQDKAAAEDRIICVRKGEILLKEEGGAIEFPKWEEFGAAGKEPTFLFAIDGEKYFLVRDLELPGYRYEKMAYLRTVGPKHKVYAGLYGLTLAGWYAAHTYCGRCGKPMVHDSKERMMRCPECGLMEFPKICPCVIVGIIHDGKILVSQYAGGRKDHYALIAGFAEFGESIEDCVHREVFEETGLKVKNLKFYTSQPWAFSESLLMGFYCELDGAEDITLQEEELSMAKFVTPDELMSPWDDFSMTNEMLCKFRHDMKKYGELRLDIPFNPEEESR